MDTRERPRISICWLAHQPTMPPGCTVEDMRLPVISLEDLIANKSATGRTQDLADVERLRALLQPKSQG
jgi:hypothetical protein